MSIPPETPQPPPQQPHESQFRTQLIALIDDALTGNPSAALVAARFLPGEIEWLQRKAVAHARAGYDAAAHDSGMELGVDRLGHRIGQERQRLQLVQRRLLHCVHPTHHLGELLLARVAEAGNAVE